MATLVVVTASGYGLAEQARYADEAHSQATDYAEHATHKIIKPCGILPKTERAVCIEKAKTEYDLETANQRRESYDLAAQRKSALWTGIMGVAALIGMALSAVGVLLVWTTFRATRHGNEIAQDTARRQLRAYIGIETGTLVRSGGSTSVELVLKNFGQTPAYKFRAGIMLVIRPENHPVGVGGPADNIAAIDLAPSQGHMLIAVPEGSSAVKTVFPPEGAKFYALIACEFIDVFEEPHTFKACLLDSGGGGLTPYPFHEGTET